MTDFQKNISTSNTSRPITPQLTITNPLDKISFVNLLEIVPDAEFTLKGKLIITINDVTVFDNSEDSNSFKQVMRKLIPLDNPELRKGSSGKIKFFVWNGSDSNTVEISIGVSIGENQINSSATIVPVSKEITNTLISESEILFTKILRTGTDENKILDLK